MRRFRRPVPSGFTLIELLVVVTIVALLASMAIVQLLRARIVTNELVALTSLRLIAKSCNSYFLERQAYPAALADLGPPTSDPPYFTDPHLLAGAKGGYTFTYTLAPAGDPSTFIVLANPQTYGITGVRHFWVDQTVTIRFTQENRDATGSDPILPP